MSRLINAGINVSLMNQSHLMAVHYAAACGHCHVLQLVSNNSSLIRVPKKHCISQNFIKCPLIVIILALKIAQKIKLCKMRLFSISPNLRKRSTVINADKPYSKLSHNAELFSGKMSPGEAILMEQWLK